MWGGRVAVLSQERAETAPEAGEVRPPVGGVMLVLVSVVEGVEKSAQVGDGVGDGFAGRCRLRDGRRRKVHIGGRIIMAGAKIKCESRMLGLDNGIHRHLEKRWVGFSASQTLVDIPGR
jgi:hypothetical protein